jgi:hypothetical protein
MTKYLRKLLQEPTSQLVEVSEHRTDKTDNRLIIMIEGKKYTVLRQTLTSTQSITIGMIPNLFQSGVPVCVELRSESWNKKICLICFEHIPEIPRQFFHSSQHFSIPQLNFSVCVFKEDFISIFQAKNSDDCSHQYIALGHFNFMSFIEQFKWVSSNEWRFQVLWGMLVHSLFKIGYFDFFNYNHFMSIVFNLFQRMFSLNENMRHVRLDVLKELFFSFIQRLLMKNSWFLICGELIRTVRSSALIDLFSDPLNPPIVNFIDRELGFIGVSKTSGVGNDSKLNFFLFSLKTKEVIPVGVEDRTWYPDIGDESRGDNIDDDFDDGPLERIPTPSKPESIQQGILPFGHDRDLFVLIPDFSIHVFIRRRPNGTFEYFNIWLFVLLHALETNESLYQLTMNFTYLRYIGSSHLTKGLEQCGVLPILRGTATLEEIYHFFYVSDFGVVLKVLRQKLPEFQERLYEHYSMKYQEETNSEQKQGLIQYRCNSIISSIKSNRFIKEFMSFLTPVLEQLQERRDLTPEIIEILQFLKELFAFFTPAPLALALDM